MLHLVREQLSPFFDIQHLGHVELDLAEIGKTEFGTTLQTIVGWELVKAPFDRDRALRRPRGSSQGQSAEVL